MYYNKEFCCRKNSIALSITKFFTLESEKPKAPDLQINMKLNPFFKYNCGVGRQINLLSFFFFYFLFCTNLP